jgi:inner membrane transporter RhtA
MSSTSISKTERVPLSRPVLPPWLLVVIGITSVQIGAGIAKGLFDAIGFSSVVFLRCFIGGLIFMLLVRPRLRGYPRHIYGYMLLYGATIAGNMLTFYAAIERIPLGITVAIAFAGPLLVSVLGSRRALDFLWIVLAAVGILLLSPFTNTDLDPVGLLLAGVCACAWGIYVVVSKRVSGLLPGNTMLALGMSTAALVAAPFGAVSAAQVLTSPSLLATTLIVALLSSIIPFWLDFSAIKHLEPRVYGMLVSLEAAISAVIGWIILHEELNLQTVIGIGLVTLAAAATTLTARNTPTAEEELAATPVE